MLEFIDQNVVRILMLGGFSGVVTVAGVYFKTKVKGEISIHNKDDTAHSTRFRHYGRELGETNDQIAENKGQLNVLTERLDQRFQAVTDILEKQDQQTQRLDDKLDRILQKV